ncbi:MAG: tetratricopeptide repeat protein [Candidatus Kariarchaeaceae archaeon]
MSLSNIRSLLYSGKLDEALDLIKKEEENASEDDPEQFVEIQLMQSEIFLIRGFYQNSLDISKKMIDYCANNDLKLLKLDAIILLGEVYWRLGQFDQSLVIIEKGEQELIKEVDPKSHELVNKYAEFKKLKGIYYRYNGELDLAYEYFLESLSEFNKLDDAPKIGSLLNYIGLVYHDQGELNEAWNYYIQSLEIKDQTDDLSFLPISYYNLGRIQIDRGELESALEYLMQCLELSTKFGDKRLIGRSYNVIGLIFHNQGKTDAAFEHLTQSLAIQKEIGNDLETSWTLYRIMDLLLSTNKRDLQYTFFDELEVISNRNTQDKIINLHHRLLKARIFKSSSRTIKRAEAQRIFNEIALEEIIDYELTISSMLNLSEELLFELRDTGNEQILDELIDLFNKLVAVANEQNSFSLLTEIYILQSKFALLELDLKKAQTSLSQALSIAEDRGLRRLAVKISNQYDDLLEQINHWRELNRKETSILERVEQAELEQFIAGMIRKRSDEVIIEKDNPILLMILASDGNKLFSQRFTQDSAVNDQMIALFLMGINNVINEAISVPGSVERLKHGDFMLVVNHKDDASFLYLFKGTASYSAVKRLDEFVNQLVKEEDLWTKVLDPNVNAETYYKSVTSIVDSVFSD